MQILNAILLLVGTTAVTAAPTAELTARDDILQWCGGQRYLSSMYVCYDDVLLCPIGGNGMPYHRCQDGCYDPIHYNCISGGVSNGDPSSPDMMLVGIPEVPSAPSNAFTLLAVSAGEPKVINETVEACGQYFWVKGDGACSYCPPVVERTGFCPAGNETVLFGSSLSVEVPGGQRYFIDTHDGSFGFTTAHSSSIPNGAIQDFVTTKSGTFEPLHVRADAAPWIACSASSLPGSGDSPTYKVFANLPDIQFGQECHPIELFVDGWEGKGVYAAWQYV